MPVADVMISGSTGVLPDVRRRPRRASLVIGPPHRLAGSGVERGDVGLLIVVIDDVEAAVVQHRRGRRAPAVVRRHRRHRTDQSGVPDKS